MFGYIKPVKAEMKVKEWDTYQAIYCGLCKQLAKDYGWLARMTLSYDFAFLALFSSGLAASCSGYAKKRCPVHPLRKRYCMCASDDLGFAASAQVFLVEAKLRDNLQDAGFLKRLLAGLLLPWMRRKKKKAAKRFPELETLTETYLLRQKEVEAARCTSIDRAAEPTAQVLAGYFAALTEDTAQKLVLSRIGYLTGRYVYLMDALDDLEDDAKSGDYNVYLARLPAKETPDFQAIRTYAKETLSLTVGQLAEAFELLTLRRFRSILQNIIYLGFPQGIERVLQRAQKEQKKTWLERF